MTEPCTPPERTFALPMEELVVTLDKLLKATHRPIEKIVAALAQIRGAQPAEANPWPPTDSEGDE